MFFGVNKIIGSERIEYKCIIEKLNTNMLTIIKRIIDVIA